eukprot:Awhi_evm1s5812
MNIWTLLSKLLPFSCNIFNQDAWRDREFQTKAIYDQIHQIFHQRRDIAGECLSNYDYRSFTSTCSIGDDNCAANYRATTFLRDGQCQCVCAQWSTS